MEMPGALCVLYYAIFNVLNISLVRQILPVVHFTQNKKDGPEKVLSN